MRTEASAGAGGKACRKELGKCRLLLPALLDGLVERGGIAQVVQALAVAPRELGHLGKRRDQLGAIGEATLVVQLRAVLDAPVPIGMRDVVLIIIDVHKHASLGAQVVEELLEAQGYRLVSLQSHNGLLAVGRLAARWPY